MEQPELDRFGKRPEGRGYLARIVLIDVGDHVAGPLIGLQMLGQDVQPVFGQHPVDPGQDAGPVAVDVQEPVPTGHIRQLDVGEIDGKGRVAPMQISKQPVGREVGDGGLGFLGRAADMGAKDYVAQATGRRAAGSSPGPADWC